MENGPPRMSVDQMLWMGIGSNPGKMLSWAMMGSVVVAMVTTVILSDTVNYYDHFGFTDKKLAIGLAVGTLAVLSHLAITIAQAFELSLHAYSDYANITLFDLYANTTSDLIGGCFALWAASYYSIQVFKLSRRNYWVMIPIIALNLGTFIMTIAVAGTGFNCPKAEFATMMELIQFNLRRIPFFKAWGIFAFMGDVTIWIAMTYYLFRVKGSMLHRQRKLLAKLQTILLETMFPPVLICLILLATADTKSANIGDYRRAVRVLLPVFYYLSPLHSIVARIHIKEAFSSEDDTTNPDSIPLSPKTSQWPDQDRGQHSTIHIDPLRGKHHSIIGATSTSQGVGGGLEPHARPAKGTFGLVSQIDTGSDKSESPPEKAGYQIRKDRKEHKSAITWQDPHIPSKMTFGYTGTIEELESSAPTTQPDSISGPMRF